MASRTYLIGLYLALKATKKYITKWQIPLQAVMTTEQYRCLVAVLDAVNECLPLIVPAPPVT